LLLLPVLPLPVLVAALRPLLLLLLLAQLLLALPFHLLSLLQLLGGLALQRALLRLLHLAGLSGGC